MRKDVVLFLQMLKEPCATGTSEHSWRKCRRCLAIAQIETRDPLAMRLLERAIQIIELAVPTTAQQECNHDFKDYVVCCKCGQTAAATGDCHHCGDPESIRNGRCHWCLKPLETK